MFGTLLAIPMYIFSIAYIICVILLIVKMFQHGDKTLGIVTAVTIPCGIGLLIGLVMGWMNVRKYNAMLLMLIYTVSLFLAPASGFISAIWNP